MKDTKKTIDWAEVKSRLQESQRALETAFDADTGDLEAIYRARAAELAHRGVHEAQASALRVLVFTIGSERYALEFADLVELLPFVNCTPIPGAPPQLLGVMNIHGEIRSVLDLGKLLELPERESRPAGYVLLVRKQSRATALRVDGIDRLQFVDPQQLLTPSAGETGSALHYLRGLTPERLRLLNTEAILAHLVYKGRSG